jgi:hypothetical protein
MKWGFENLRRGKYDMSDLVLVCNGVDVPCHAVYMTSASQYFNNLLGNPESEERRTMRVVFDDCTERQMESILRYVYTCELSVCADDVLYVCKIAFKLMLEELQVECESMIMKMINLSNVGYINELAQEVLSQRMMELCQDIMDENKP